MASFDVELKKRIPQMNKLLTLCSLVVAITVGCAGADVRPLVDMKGVNESAYENDLSECQAYAKQ